MSVHSHTHKHTHTHCHKHTHSHKHTYTHKQTNTHTHTHTHTLTNTHSHTHTHTLKQNRKHAHASTDWAYINTQIEKLIRRYILLQNRTYLRSPSVLRELKKFQQTPRGTTSCRPLQVKILSEYMTYKPKHMWGQAPTLTAGLSSVQVAGTSLLQTRISNSS